ncbi:MAG TPA: glyceraldehyde-3-phosphate dehydrogenase [Bacteroidales bacterium]|nr:glyceraldehyde-3-phosphate dehydrogenase [Bacteroidales bacterium]HSA43337.1 glyceraldehyde-3-phosphate dehydrogenase [Bacteroidales bacterium]
MDNYIPIPVNDSPNSFEETLSSWIDDIKAANEFVEVVHKLWYDKGIELILFRRQLIDRSGTSILHKHSYAQNIIKKPLVVHDSLLLARALQELDVAPARIDMGRLNSEWLEGKTEFGNDPKAFVSAKLAHIIKVKPRSDHYQDVVLYGFGRIGRILARELVYQAGNGSQLRLRAIVTRSNSAEDIRKRASLFRKDSVHGPFDGIAIEDVENKRMYINGHIVHFLAGNNPEDIDYEEFGIKDALLIDNTGISRDRAGLSRHLKAKGVKRVLLTAPGKGDIPNIVYGVNQDTCNLNPEEEQVFSAASCTTNAVVPVLSVIERELGIVRGHIETIHSYTNDQNLLDNYHKKTRRGRSAPLNMVITETGAASAAVKAIPSLKGKLTANSVRVPTPNVSLVIVSLNIARDIDKDAVNEIMRQASLKGTLIEQIRYSTSSELVSTDVIGDSCACVFDSAATLVSDDKRNIVLYAWYDNEFGYSMQVMRLAKHLAQVKSYRYY